MKKIILLSSMIVLSHTLIFAQKSDTAGVKKEMTKEEKAAQKAKQEADLLEAFKEAGLSEAQITSCKDAIAAAGKKSSELKKNQALTEDEKATAKKVISDEKNAQLKQIMGDDAYRKYNAARKRQKEAAGKSE